MLDKKSDDYLRNIIQDVDLREQIKLAETSERFRLFIQPLWAARYEKIDLNFRKTPFTSSGFRIFMQGICDSVQYVNVVCICRDLLEVLTEFTYPKVEELRFITLGPFKLNSQDLLPIQASFPNLRAVWPHGKFIGKDITHWKNLEKIGLLNCKGFKLGNVLVILKELQLKMLHLDVIHDALPPLEPPADCLRKMEKLIVSSCEFNWMTQNSNPFDDIKEILIMDYRYSKGVFIWLQKFKATELIEMCATNHAIGHYEPRVLQLERYENLKKFKIIGRRTNMENVTRSIQHGYLLELREVFLLACVLFSPSSIFNLLKANHHFDLISIERCRFEFSELDIHVQDIVHFERKTPFVVNFHKNFFERATAVKIFVIGASPFLMVTFVQKMHQTTRRKNEFLQLKFK